jgi:hypothetical protein
MPHSPPTPPWGKAIMSAKVLSDNDRGAPSTPAPILAKASHRLPPELRSRFRSRMLVSDP